MSNPTGDALAAFAAKHDTLANANGIASEKLQEAAKEEMFLPGTDSNETWQRAAVRSWEFGPTSENRISQI